MRSLTRASIATLAALLMLPCAARPCAARSANAASEPARAPDSTTTSTRAPENAFPVTLGNFSTTLVGSVSGRTHNIRLACQALDGVVLAPGDVLSFNRTVGARTAERGYCDAPVILRENRQLQLGGGICQVASTLFVAGLVSGLSVVDRHRHSTPVNYIPLGQDATISWGVKDLKLRNDLGESVRVHLEVLGSTLTARIEAEAPLRESYELYSDVRESVDALAGAPGREIELYRIRRVDGEERDRELVHRDVFPIARVRSPEEGR